MVESVVPRDNVGIVAGATLNLVQVDAGLVVVPTVLVGLAVLVTSNLEVDVATAIRIVQREAGQGRLIAELHRKGGTIHLGAVHNGSLGVDTEVVRNGLFSRRGAVVVGGNRQLVVAVGKACVLAFLQVDGPRLLPLFNPAHPFFFRIDGRLEVLEGGEGGNALARLIRVRGGHLVNAAQRARARADRCGCTRDRGTGDHVALSVRTTLAFPPLEEGVVAEEAAPVTVVDARGSSVGVTLGNERIEDRRLGPGSVEAQERNAQVGLTVRTRGEAHETVQEGARRSVGGDVLSKLVAGLDINADRGFTLGRNRHARAREGNADALAVPVSGVTGEETALNVLGQSLGRELVRSRRVGHVVQGDVEVPAVGAVPQFRLGAGRVGSTVHGRVHGRGRGTLKVRQACTLLTRGVVGTATLSGIHNRDRSSHDQVLDNIHLLTIIQRREERVVLNALKHDGAGTGHLGRCHGRTGHHLVAAAGHGGVDVAAGGGHLRLEAHVRRHAPRAEIGHLVVAVCPVPRVLNGRDRDHRSEGARLTQGRGIRVRGVGQVLARLVAVAGLELVAASNVESDALLLQLLVHAREQGVGIAVHAGRAAEGHVHGVRMQSSHVIQGCEQRGVGDAATAAARNLRNDDLSIGGDTHDLITIGCGDAGDVRAVGTRRGGIVVTVRVVVGEGELLGHVGAALAHLLCQRCALGTVDRGSSVQGSRECGVVHFHARVDDGDDLAFALLSNLVSVHHDLRAQVIGVLRT